jgi:zinc protease
MRRALALLFPAVLLLFLAAAAPARAGGEPAAAAARPNVLRETLSNGLEAIVEERRGAPTVACRVYVKTGSIYEDRFLGAGISHFYEHLLAGGTTSTRGEDATAKIVQSLGGEMNAYTTYDVTCYHITTTGEHYGTALDLLADWMANNTLDPREVARERQVVQRELEKDEDEPAAVLWRVFAETAYRVHPVRVPVIGYKPNIDRLTRDDLVAFYRDRYVPNNAVVAVVGDVDGKEALERVKKAFEGWERRPLPPFPLPAEPPQVAPRWMEKEMGVQVTLAKLGFPTIDLFDEDLYPLDLLAFILSEGEASRLVRRVVHDERLANRVAAASWTPSFVRGELTIDLEVADHAKLDQAVKAVLAEVDGLRRAPPASDEIERAKRQKIAEHVFATQSNEDRAEDLATSLISTGDPFFSEHYVERIQRVSADDLVRVARKYLDPERLTVAIVKPRGAPASKLAEEPKGEAARAKPEIEKVVLPNGLILLVKPMPGAGGVALRATFRGGVRAETPETSGRFRLLAQTMVRGTAGHAPEALAAAIEGLGGTLRGDAGYTTFAVEGAFLARDAAAGVSLLREVLREPTFPEAELAREKEESRFAAAAADDDWLEEGTFLLREAVFGPHPYGMRPFGTKASIDATTREALVALHRAYVVPPNGVIALFGDIDPAVAVRLLREAFADWQGAPPPIPEAPLPAPLLSPREVSKRTDKEQTTIALGYPGISIESGDRYALEVIDAVTSGIGLPSGWLHEALRGGKRSLVYFVHALNWMAVDGGIYYIITRCNPPDEAKVEAIIRDVQRRIVEEPVPEDDLARAKSICVTALEIGYETPAQQAAAASATEIYGLGYDFAERYPARIAAVTKEDVTRVAKKVFGPGVLAVVRPEGAAGGGEEKKRGGDLR